jgi:hypothetical protein
LAFAAAVIKQEKRLADCPHLDKETIARYEGKSDRPVSMEGIREDQLKELKKAIEAIDLPSRAELLGGRSSGETLVIQCLGKDFEIDRYGNVLRNAIPMHGSRSRCRFHTAGRCAGQWSLSKGKGSM